MDTEPEARSAMQVSADIRRWDLTAFNLYMLPRIKRNWILFGLLALYFYMLLYAFGDRNDLAYLAYGVVHCAFLGAAAFAFAFLLTHAYSLFKASDRNGVLGMHVFTLREDGFHQQSRFDESLNRWAGVDSVVVWKHGLYIRLNRYLFHLIPARAFASRADFQNFSTSALERWKAATGAR